MIKMKYYFYLLTFLPSFFNNCYGAIEKVGNPDNTAEIEKPCPVYDLNCIRAFFENHAHCKKSFGPVPDPIVRPQTNEYFPKTNISASGMQLVSGLNGRVEEFYINKATDNLVIAVEFRNLSQSTYKELGGFFKFHRRAKEPVVTRADAFLMLGSVTVTAVIPRIDDLHLQDAECTAFSNTATPVLILSPAIAESTDPQPSLGVAEFSANLSVSVQELLFSTATYYITTYIQYNVCDFGVLVS